MTHARKTILTGIFAAIFVAGLCSVPAFAQTPASKSVVEEQKKQLEAELAQLEQEIAEKQKVLDGQKTKSASIQRDVSILTTKIQQTQLDIKAKNLTIQKLTSEINQKNKTIETLSEKMDKQKESLAQLLRKTNELDRSQVVNLILSGATLSEFYSDLDSFDSIKMAVRDSVAEIKSTKNLTESEKAELKKKQDAENDARIALEDNKKKIQQNENEKKTLLNISKNQEKTYQQILNERAAKAAQIRSALFALRDTAAIPFGDAYKYALEVQKVTGVRPAFLLAILTQETNLGENIGQCLVKDFLTGDGVGKNTGRAFSGIMKPSRDIPPFLEIARKLGFDAKMQPVSCPQPGGYGGAMGPSQFIPSTWAGLEARIARAAGVSTPNPWAPRDAFYASAIFLSDLGAGAGTPSAEFEAAARYYAGGAWKTRGTGYATSVAGHARKIQETMIDPLQNV